ncbi:3-oxoacyl-ACP synthase III family protein [Actinomadura algeriensis]|uniref:3-oxoacyl-[acyl-carrier-protein] synthase-3 n=1 Tax=Actinomadura algeriensis TaxID=1679523 RepID=A0ABR9K1W0_9ACTN|nr:ketoacyl-ACP synthase III [Actinomadura algeriensis]MBE1536310.1 3-oxoacyl-[acyl-carrier-protein] synthase-3 [Actinomadura algeriensis]
MTWPNQRPTTTPPTTPPAGPAPGPEPGGPVPGGPAPRAPGWGVRGTGSHLPRRRVPSEEVSRSLGLDPGWIERRTGIRERRVAAAGEASSDLAARAARRAMADAGIGPDDVGLIVLGTSTPDELGPSTACRVQALLGARRAAAFDVAAACTGFVYGLQTAVGWLATQRGAPPCALVIGVEVYSKFLDPGDRGTAALFGDGAAAAVVGPVAPGYGIGPVTLGSDGTRAGDVLIPAGGGRRPASAATLAERGHTIHMDGRAVRDFIAATFPRLVAEAADGAGIKPGELSLVVPHQPNPALVASLAPAAGLEPGQLAIAGHDVGNIGAASLPYALDTALRARPAAPGDLVLLAGFGAGLTWGHTIITWPPPS